MGCNNEPVNFYLEANNGPPKTERNNEIRNDPYSAALGLSLSSASMADDCVKQTFTNVKDNSWSAVTWTLRSRASSL